MISHEIRNKLQNIVNGTRFEGPADNCTTVRNLLIEGFGTGSTVKSEFEGRAFVKQEQANFLRAWAEEMGIWLDNLPNGEFGLVLEDMHDEKIVNPVSVRRVL